MSVCFEDDEFVRDLPRWVATLDDGRVAYQDDGRPGLSTPSAWVRLRQLCHAEGRHIVRLALQFRSNLVPLWEGAAGYFFCKKIAGVWGADREFASYLVGWYQDGISMVHEYSIPELELLSVEPRETPTDSPSLILRSLIDGMG